MVISEENDAQDEVLRDYRVGCGYHVGRRNRSGAAAAAAITQHDLLCHQRRSRQGGRLGGLDGADRQCQALAQAAGAGAKTWRAYLSTQAADGAAAVNARDRIGRGPWQNFKGEVVAKSVEDLHSDGNKLSMETSLTERGTMVAGTRLYANYHDALTGSQADGRAFPPGEDRTCHNWTSSTKGVAMVGHIDRKGLATSRVKIVEFVASLTRA